MPRPPYGARGCDYAFARISLQIGFNGVRVVEIIDHQSVGLLQTVCRIVGQGIDSLDASTVAEMKSGHRIVRALSDLGTKELVGDQPG